MKKTTIYAESFKKIHIENKYNKELSIKIRLQNNYDKLLNLPNDGILEFKVSFHEKRPYVYFDNHIVQQLDFNRGGASDDMNMPNTEYNRSSTIYYRSGFGSKNKMVEFKDGTNDEESVAEFPFVFLDQDGIDGGEPAKIALYFQDETLTARILPLQLDGLYGPYDIF